jgi:N-acetylglutamate synthase-like GNAT family acetyltransferase
MAIVEAVKTAGNAAETDELLWRILWQPLGLPRDIRSKFNIDGEELELTAKENGQIVGGLVAVWTADNEMELRHLAVASSVQRKGIGRSLVTKLCRIASFKMCHRIHTIARNTSSGFFREVGFRTIPGHAPEHPVFLEHGITFVLMERIIEPFT